MSRSQLFALATSLIVAACGSSPSSPTATTVTLGTVSLSASTIASGLSVTATVTLTAAAPAAGAVVTLASSSDAATVPASVIVASGSTSQMFEIQTAPATIPVTVTITATYADQTRTATLALGRLAIQSISLSSSSVVGGSPVFGTVTLTAPAPAGGLPVSLTSDSALATMPGTVTIPGGETGHTFEIDTSNASTLVVVAITATLPYSASTKTTSLTIGRIEVEALSVGIDALPGGLPVSGTVTLSVAAPVDLSVALSSSGDVARVPPSVTIPAGTVSQTFDITTMNSPPTRTVTISATYGTSSRIAPLTVIAYPILATLTCSSTTPKGGASVQCTGTLTSPAPAGGWELTLSSSDDSLAGAVPANVTAAASSDTFRFEVVTAPVSTSTTAVVRIADARSGMLLYSQAFTIAPS